MTDRLIVTQLPLLSDSLLPPKKPEKRHCSTITG